MLTARDWLVLNLVALATACGDGGAPEALPGDPCAEVECAPHFSCRAGKCLYDSACIDSSDCEGGQRCVDGACRDQEPPDRDPGPEKLPPGTACDDDAQCESGLCRVALANLETAVRTCVRDDDTQALLDDPTGACAHAGYDDHDAVSTLCSSAACQAQCTDCSVSRAHPYVAFAYCEYRCEDSDCGAYRCSGYDTRSCNTSCDENYDCAEDAQCDVASGECIFACLDPRSDAEHCTGCFRECGVTCRDHACTTVTEFRVAGQHGCAQISDGTMECWGDNTFRQYGVETTNGTGVVDVLEPGERLEVGYHSACAYLPGGGVRCWGFNEGAITGQGTTSFTSLGAPPVPGVTGVVDVSVYDSLACAVTSEGKTWCWGDNLRDGPSPVERFAGETLRAVAVDHNDICGLRTDGTLTVGCRDATSLVGVTQVEMSSHTGCALLDNGEVYCWGANSHGQLGDGTLNAGSSTYPMRRIDNIPAALDVCVGSTMVCALSTSREVYCWGSNDHGELGLGSESVLERPGNPALLPVPVTDIECKSYNVCARAEDGLYCWGDFGGATPKLRKF
jgi:hypothetical protein